MGNLKHYVDKVEDENKDRLDKKEHQCELDNKAKATKTQSKMKFVFKNIKLEMGNIKHHVDKVENENKVHTKRKEHHGQK